MNVSAIQQQVVRAIRLFLITFIPLATTSVKGAVAAGVAGVVAAAEVAWRIIFPVTPGLKALKKTPRTTDV